MKKIVSGVTQIFIKKTTNDNGDMLSTLCANTYFNINTTSPTTDLLQI